jgi:hypothetical protein
MKISIFHNLIFFFFLKRWRLFGSSRKCQKSKENKKKKTKTLADICGAFADLLARVDTNSSQL